MATASRKSGHIILARYKLADNGACYSGGPARLTYDLTDPFTLCVIGDTVGLHRLVRAQPQLLKATDPTDATLLYKAARSGFRDMVEMLLVLGCPVDSQIHMGSTALHAASFYGHGIVVALLLARNANRDVRNKYGLTALDEACNETIQRHLGARSMQDALQALVAAGVAEGLRPVALPDGRVVAWKVARSPSLVRRDLIADSRPPPEWEVAWHGTLPEHLESIMRHNLQPAGGSAGGVQIEVHDDFIPLGEPFFGITDFARAVFVSPCVGYAAHPCYAGRIGSDSDEWLALIETRVRPGSFQTFQSTAEGYVPLADSVEPEYRVATELPGHATQLPGHAHVDEAHDILRVASGGGLSNCVAVGAVFLSKAFLDECHLSNPELSRLLANASP